MTHARRQPGSLAILGGAALLVVIALSGCSPQQLDDGTPIAWPGDGPYKDRAKAMKLTQEQAYRNALKAAGQRGQTAIDPEPLLIVGDEYLFGTHSERGVWLTGFYVNGQTGTVEFRMVDRMLYRGMVGDLLHP